MSSFNIFRKAAARFSKDEKGNFAILLGATIPMLMIGVGVGVNVVQMTGSRSQLTNALDAALTSTARDITLGIISAKDAKKTALAFLQANTSNGFIDSSSVKFASFHVDRAKQTIEATAEGKASLAFPVFSMPEKYDIAVDAATLYADNTVEVSMMLDVTGSMGGQKLQDLKIAARNAVSTFLDGQRAGFDRVRLAIVPYADSVNTGVLSNVVHIETGPGNGNPPALDDPQAVATAPDKCATERKGYNQFSDASPYSGKINRDYRLAYCPNAELVTLTADKTRLNVAIDSFNANGATAGHIGIQWAWYMLSPKWKNVMPTGSEAGNYKDKKVRKFAILMTDGEFNTAFSDVPDTEATRGAQGPRSRSKAQRLCAEMKKKGIEVFTIGFQLNTTNAKSVMKSCASTSKNYYETSSGSELNAAFQEIAKNIESLTITR